MWSPSGDVCKGTWSPPASGTDAVTIPGADSESPGVGAGLRSAETGDAAAVLKVWGTGPVLCWAAATFNAAGCTLAVGANDSTGVGTRLDAAGIWLLGSRPSTPSTTVGVPGTVFTARITLSGRTSPVASTVAPSTRTVARASTTPSSSRSEMSVFGISSEGSVSGMIPVVSANSSSDSESSPAGSPAAPGGRSAGKPATGIGRSPSVCAASASENEPATVGDKDSSPVSTEPVGRGLTPPASEACAAMSTPVIVVLVASYAVVLNSLSLEVQRLEEQLV